MQGTLARLAECLRADLPVALATVVARSPSELPGDDLSDDPLPELGAKLLVGPGLERCGSLGSDPLDRQVELAALAALDAGLGETRRYDRHGGRSSAEVTVFIEVFAPARRMVVLGAVDFTAALVRVAKAAGYRVTVCDARPTFATQARFPEADEVVVEWPHRYLASPEGRLGPRDAICVLTHDHKFDVPALAVALRSSVGYIGAMGSRHTHAGRVDRLRAEGLGEGDLARVMAPIGIDIGARTPEETAVAICAEIIAVQTGTPAASLRDGSGPIHRMLVS